MPDFKQTVQIGKNVTDIMRIPCVVGCYKMQDRPNEVIYHMLSDVRSDGPLPIRGRVGDWLCQDSNGRWMLLTNEEYNNMK